MCYLFNVALRASISRKTPDVSTPLTNVVALLSCRVVTPINSSTSPKTEFTRVRLGLCEVPLGVEENAVLCDVSDEVRRQANEGEMFGAILGTGVGGGIVIEKQILTGLNRIGGEWGHNPFPWATESERPGYRCYCGKFGCIETFLSGTDLAREYFSLSQKEFNAEWIAAAEEAGVFMVRSLAMYKHRLARSLAVLVNN